MDAGPCKKNICLGLHNIFGVLSHLQTTFHGTIPNGQRQQQSTTRTCCFGPTNWELPNALLAPPLPLREPGLSAAWNEGWSTWKFLTFEAKMATWLLVVLFAKFLCKRICWTSNCDRCQFDQNTQGGKSSASHNSSLRALNLLDSFDLSISLLNWRSYVVSWKQRDTKKDQLWHLRTCLKSWSSSLSFSSSVVCLVLQL